MAKVMQQDEVPAAGVTALAMVGAILLGISFFLGSEKLALSLTALVFGVLSLGLAAYFRRRNQATAAEFEAAPSDWAQAEADAVEFVYSSEQHLLPGRLVARFRDAEGREHVVRTGELGFDPRPLLPSRVTVRYQAGPGSDFKAKIDTGFLPDVEFLTWPSLAETIPDIRDPILREGRPVDTALAGFRYLATSDIDNVRSYMVMLQHQDAATGKLQVLEGFVVTTEGKPLPDWQPGKRFPVRFHRTERGLFLVDRTGA